MHYAFVCRDKPGGMDIRKANRDAHLAYLRSLGDRIFAAGPLLTDDGQAMIGSLLVVECADKADADAFAAGDPYAKAGLFQSVTIAPWRKVLP
jgi:uncharacterized protein YciI